MQRPWGTICDLKQVWYHLIPQWASPQIPWEHWGPFWDLCDCHTQLLWSWLVPFHALKLHLPRWEPSSPMAEHEFEWRGTVCSCLASLALRWGLPSDTDTAGLPSSQISFIERDIWATLCLVPRSQGIMPLHWGTLVTCTWVLVSLLCSGGYLFHSCIPKNSDVTQ